LLEHFACSFLVFAGATVLFAQSGPEQTQPNTQNQAQRPGELKQREQPPTNNGQIYTIEPGTQILLNMINSVSTKQAAVGDRIYLETAFPVMASNRIVIPQGSWVTGTITAVTRPGRVKGKGSLQVRFDSLTLPNGVTKSFRSDLGAIDPRSDETLQREGSKIKGPGNKKGDAGTVIGTTAAGTVIGSGVGAAAGNAARGAGIGAGAGAAAALIGVLMTRGPDAMLTKGSTVTMVLDRSLNFEASDLDFSHAPPRAALAEGDPSGGRSQRQQSRFPF
jgi:type IV secretion system protein VirB10